LLSRSLCVMMILLKNVIKRIKIEFSENFLQLLNFDGARNVFGFCVTHARGWNTIRISLFKAGNYSKSIFVIFFNSLAQQLIYNHQQKKVARNEIQFIFGSFLTHHPSLALLSPNSIYIYFPSSTLSRSLVS
jgi:hypothetical protein